MDRSKEIQRIQVNDVVRWKTIIGKVSWLSGSEAGLVSLENINGGVVAKLDQLEFITRPKPDEPEKDVMARIVGERRAERERNMELFRVHGKMMKEVVKRLKEGDGPVDEIIKNLETGGYKDVEDNM